MMAYMSTDQRNTFLLAFAWLVAIVATAGSLYFSEVRRFLPCELCWYQRILMYPLALILGIANWYGDLAVRRYVLPLSVIGGTISLIHYLTQKVEGFALFPCKPPVPCAHAYVNYFGFVTIPFMALTAFVLITLAMLLIQARTPSRG